MWNSPRSAAKAWAKTGELYRSSHPDSSLDSWLQTPVCIILLTPAPNDGKLRPVS